MASAGEVMVSVSGVRGVVGRGLTPELAASFAAALAAHVGGGRVVVGRDSRPSGRMLRHAVAAGLLSGGCDVLDLGVVPTPTCGLAVRSLAAAGGVMITASHNPSEWNGLKLFGRDGAVLTAAEGRAVQARFAAGDLPRVGWDAVGREKEVRRAPHDHADRVRELADRDRIRARHYRVVLDANGGAGGYLGRELLKSFGCAVTAVGCGMDGDFVHEPE